MSPTKKKIIELITSQGQVTVVELVRTLGISKQALHKHLNDLMKAHLVMRVGTPPRVIYRMSSPSEPKTAPDLTVQQAQIVDERYLTITPDGMIKQGVEGFEWWCARQRLPMSKTADEYIHTLEKYDMHRHAGIIDATEKIHSTFPHSALDKLYYLDFYSIERFGKTKLGALMLYAKQSQQVSTMQRVFDLVVPSIQKLASDLDVDMVGYIPPTVARNLQFQRELARVAALPIRSLDIFKVSQDVPVPQKTLSKIEDRILNAESSLYISPTAPCKNLLLIDDAVGSGATIAIVADKVKAAGIVTGKIIGLALTGSYKGFEVIQEV